MNNNKYRLKCYDGYHPRIDVTQEFINKNNLKLVRSHDEILAYGNKHDGMFSFSKEILINYLPVDKSVDWIQDKHKAEHLSCALRLIDDVFETTQDFLDYMVFGWMKALDQRGISASRTIDKCATWMWLLGRDDVEQVLRDNDLYNPYGVPALIKACEKLGISVPEDVIEFSKNKCNE